MPKVEFFTKRFDYDNGSALMVKIGDWRNEVRFKDHCSLQDIKNGLHKLVESIDIKGKVMPKIFLCVDYGSPENWILEEFESVEKVLEDIKKGKYLGLGCKIVKELAITVKEENDHA